ncbi:MAG: L-2-hydroxyglutarate oxidase [Dehalococcoidales bacterium]|jgi:L-2-hydroxyglutarate oxidase LhgO|nr:L-2-hydroxyglutarate oxidase [Dehalococcoidales bacterium]MDP6576253.1 L-2-hydroxyglutarate oxidase [Dehalococcoidales bacterium]MDP6825124.1 L-2-hydroxyglutarate oxidase [Dehalococcoidales bacterium]
MKQNQCQILIVGAGISGLTIARQSVSQGIKDILILEKDYTLGLHSSGRNSGVLHAGMYYTPETLKAKFCVQGNRLMKKFCREKGLTLNETGKVILAGSPSEVESLYELKRRADLCGACTSLINRKKLLEIEPHAAAGTEALFSPDTAVIKPIEVIRALEAELVQSSKVTISYGTVFQGLSGDNQAQTSSGVIRFEKFINTAGSYADQVANRFGLGREYKILPFKGTYKKLTANRTSLVRGNIYPVPNLRTPFLGIHLTRTADDEILVGPTAIPAFGRENYHTFEGWGLETIAILLRDSVLMLRNPTFRQVAMTEPKKYLKWFVLKEAKKLVPELRLNDLTETEHAGIRPQLIHWPTKKLVMDYVVLQSHNSLHVLNPVSPAFTSSMAFAEDVVGRFLG